MSLLIGNTAGNDVKLYDEKIESYKNFVNKLWNIARFVLMMTGKGREGLKEVERKNEKTLADKWILSRFNGLKNRVSKELDEYNFSSAGELLRAFTWNELADWYLEIAKIENNKNEILISILKDLLKMWHPFVPFVTETIWREMGEKESIMICSWPIADRMVFDKKSEQEFETVQQMIVLIRNARAQYKISYSKELEVVIAVNKKAELIESVSTIVKQITKSGNLRIGKVKKLKTFACPNGFINAGSFSVGNVFVNVHGAIDLEKESVRLMKEQDNLNNFIVQLEKKLGNEQFVKNAPKVVVEGERAKLAEAVERLAKVNEQLASIKK